MGRFSPESVEEFKKRVELMPKDEVKALRAELFGFLELAFKLRKIYGNSIYDDLFSKYLICFERSM
jgi:hypothetical protein